MDQATLNSLVLALRATPDNAELAGVVLPALVSHGEYEKVLSLSESLDDSVMNAPECALAVAKSQWQQGRLAEALGILSGVESARASMLEARVLADQNEVDAAIAAYESAVKANAALEDPELLRELKARTNVVSLSEHQKLRVIDTDDADQHEIQRVLAPENETVTFEDVGGLENVKKQIHKRIILPFKKPSLFKRFKKKAGGGILMYGPPGCGKTLLARATAGEVEADLFSVSIADVLDMYIGESERKLSAIFERARQAAPAVLFFDEIEALGGKRTNTRNATTAKLVSLFLAEMDGFAQNNKGVLILGATNVPWHVDPAFRRPGRFDRVLFVPPPDRRARQEILGLQLADRPVTSNIPLGKLAKKTSGYSGADLADLVDTAADLAIEASIEEGREVPINARMLFDALTESKATTNEWLSTARNYARYANEGGQYDEVLQFISRHARS